MLPVAVTRKWSLGSRIFPPSRDIGAFAEAPFCPADHSKTSLSDYITSTVRLRLRTEVLNRVVDAETSSRPQITQAQSGGVGLPPRCSGGFEVGS